LGVGTASFTAVGDLNGATSAIAEVNLGVPATFDIGVTSGVGNFNTADLIIGANGIPGIGTFTYNAAWNSAFSQVSTPTYFNAGELVYYQRAVMVGGANAASVGASKALGTLVVPTTGLPLGDYLIKIDSAIDGFSNLGNASVAETISGLGTIRVVPEPASLMLLGLGAAATLRRRRA
jgi:hypothetical protein